MSEELPYVKPHTFRNVVELCNRGGGGAGSGGGGPLALICVLVRLRHFLVALACCNFSFVPQIMPNRPTRLRLEKSKLTPTRLRLEKSEFRALVLKAKLNQGCNTTMLPNKHLKLHVDTTTTTTTTNTNTTDATACVDISWVCISRFLTVHSLSCLALSSKRMAKLFAEELNMLLRLRKRKLLLKRVLKLKGVVRSKVGGFLTLNTLTKLARSNKRLASIFGCHCWSYAGYADEAARDGAKVAAHNEKLLRRYTPHPIKFDPNGDIDTDEEDYPWEHHHHNWRPPF